VNQTAQHGGQWEIVERMLRDMGFDNRAAVRAAVRETHGDMSAAVELLLAAI